MTWLRGWRPLLRMAGREALRARGRSALILVLIALPVLAVVGANVVFATTQVSGVERLDRELGVADAAVDVSPGQGRVVQGFDPEDTLASVGDAESPIPLSPAGISSALGREVPTLETRNSDVQVATDAGATRATLTEIDLADPMTQGLVDEVSGRLPERSGEVVVNAELADLGLGVGGTLRLADGTKNTVVGLVESTSVRSEPMLWGPIGTSEPESNVGAYYRTRYLLGGGPVSWNDVLALNQVGGIVTSRTVITDPPPTSELPPELADVPSSGQDPATVAVLGLVVVMVLMEVVLLAGPAFAVNARRQSRDLALMAACGGTPAQARRLVLAGAVVLGAVAAAGGTMLGLVVGWAVLPLLQPISYTYFGPLDTPWLRVLAVAALGFASALIAALVPAWIASREDIVAVLAGRRGDRAPSRRSPLLGVLLLASGVATVVVGARRPADGELLIAFGTLPAVIGMILLIPLVLIGLARLGRGLPLPMRYAVRDAARHRARTVPAVAAVAATVAGVVALGIGGNSDQAQQRATYQPGLALGDAVLTDYQDFGADGPDWPAYRAAVARILPGASLREVRGVSDGGDPQSETFTEITVRTPPSDTQSGLWLGSSLGSLVVEDDAATLSFLGYSEEIVTRARAELAAGGIVAFADQPIDSDSATLKFVERGQSDGKRVDKRQRDLPALWLGAQGIRVPAAVLSASTAEQLGLKVATTALLVRAPAGSGGISENAESDLTQTLTAISPSAYFTVERGFGADEDWTIILLILGGLGAVLMLGGTLTATFLALSDARPDLATLASVGAAPRTRRAIAASFALVVGLTGALIGVALGFLPGVAITYPLTGGEWVQQIDPSQPSHYLDIPWLFIGSLVVALPLVTALVVSAATRSRLPLVSRLD